MYDGFCHFISSIDCFLQAFIVLDDGVLIMVFFFLPLDTYPLVCAQAERKGGGVFIIIFFLIFTTQ